MSFQKVINYIKKSLKLGLKEEKIKNNLKEEGWTDKQIEKAFQNLNSKENKPKKNNSKKIKPNKKKFFSIGLVVFLVLAFGLFYFFRINKTFINVNPEEDITQSSYKILGTEGFSIFGDIDFEFNNKLKDQEAKGNIVVITELEKILEKYGLYFLAEGAIDDRDVRAKANVMTINNDLYVRWLEIFDLSLLFPTSINSDEVTGKYILYSDNLSAAIKEKLVDTPFEKELAILLGIDTDTETTKDIYNDIMDQVWEKEVLVVTNSEKEGLLMGKNKYEVDVNFDKLFDLTHDVLQKNREKIKTISNEDLDEFKENKDYFTKIEENIDYLITVWTKDGYVQRIKIDVESKGEIEEDYEADLIMDLEFKDIDERFGLERPKDYFEMNQSTEEE